MKPAPALRPSTPAAAPARAAPYRVLVIRGTQKTEEAVEWDRPSEAAESREREMLRNPASGPASARTEEPEESLEEAPK